MPTSAEFQAMKNATYWAWEDTDQGCYVYTPNPSSDAGQYNTGSGTYNKANALLFFPVADCGFSFYIAKDDDDPLGEYWCSSLDPSEPYRGYYFSFNYGNFFPAAHFWRLYGQSVRPVAD